ncbi:hypothetical protein L0337_13640 [candidate division KSB1 bacterium]|nr:hypothetical protein [candidate division KSB1 bacterium]
MKANTFVGAFFILSLPLAGWLDFQTFADEPKPPTLAERQNFQTQLDKLQSHVVLFPQNLDEAIKSLTDSVTFTFDCPETTKVRQVSVRITTRQIKWDTELRVNNEKVGIPPNAAAYYIWQPKIIIKNREKHVVANNFIMLDSDTTTQREMNPLIAPLVSEAVLYHEILHGQLLINAMLEKAWRDKACNCDFDLGPADASHEQIPELVLAYLESLAALAKQIYAVHVPPQAENDSTGYFEVVIAAASMLATRTKWESYCPEGSNVEPASFHIRIKDEKVVASGKLIDKTKKGLVLVYFTPQ